MKCLSFKILICVLFLTVGQTKFSFAASNNFQMIEDHDIQSYRPSEHGLSDLVFEIRIPKLLELLRVKKSFNNIETIYYKVYWIYPGQYSIVVNGVPKGLSGLERELRSVVREYLEYVVPEKFYSKMRPYQFEKKLVDGAVLLVGEDQTYKRNIGRIEISFDKIGTLKHLKVYHPEVRMETNTEFFFANKTWSKNRKVLHSLIRSNISEFKKVEEKINVVYQSVEGLGFPHEINVTTTVYIKAKVKDEYKEIDKKQVEILLSNFEVNTKKARRHILSSEQ